MDRHHIPQTKWWWGQVTEGAFLTCVAARPLRHVLTTWRGSKDGWLLGLNLVPTEVRAPKVQVEGWSRRHREMHQAEVSA